MKSFRDLVDGVPVASPLRLFDTVTKEEVLFDETELRYLLVMVAKGEIPTDRFKYYKVWQFPDSEPMEEWLPVCNEHGEITAGINPDIATNGELMIQLIQIRRHKEGCQ